MKKLLVFALVVILALGVFTACRRPDTGNKPTTGTTKNPTSTTASTSHSTVTIIPSMPDKDDTLNSTGPSEQPKLPGMK